MLFQEVKKMELVIITTETFFEHEAEAINALCNEGVQTLHLRKPKSTKEQMKLLLKQINPFFLNRMVLHDHFDLVQQFGLKGYHLNSRNKEVKEKMNKSVSASCHSFQELQDKSFCNYLFLSPIFNSLSKSGYQQAYSETELLQAKKNRWINEKVYALGGITPSNLSLLKIYGFGGAVILGFLWENFKNDKDLTSLVGRLKELQKTIESL